MDNGPVDDLDQPFLLRQAGKSIKIFVYSGNSNWHFKS